MGYLTIFFIALGLSMDAFAVSLCSGIGAKKNKFKTAITLASFFGFFQAAMPLIGWAAGYYFKDYITEADHWIAFVLLAFIGGKMLLESFKNKGCQPARNTTKITVVLGLAIATSIDAMAAGLSFALLEIPLFHAVGIIGIVTFIVSFAGVYIGGRTFRLLGKKAEMAGGIVLIAIGIKILLEHLLFTTAI
ncbi:MAG: manganese efflux pump MntP family protein [Bacteroidota bacterium]